MTDQCLPGIVMPAFAAHFPLSSTRSGPPLTKLILFAVVVLAV
jgi:hypothetical protein